MLRGVMTGGALELKGKWRDLVYDDFDYGMRNTTVRYLLPMRKVWQPVDVRIHPDTGYIEATFTNRDVFDVVDIAAYRSDEENEWHIEEASWSGQRLRLTKDADIETAVREAGLAAWDAHLDWDERGPGVYTFYDGDSEPLFSLDQTVLRRRLTLKDAQLLQQGRGIYMDAPVQTGRKLKQTDELWLSRVLGDRDQLVVALDSMLERGVIS